MGGTTSKVQENLKINPSQWRNIGEENGVQILQSLNQSGLQAEQQAIPLDPRRSVENELKKQDNALVSVYGAECLKSNNPSMCGNEQIMKVITQRIPKRYSELPQLTFNESLYALSQSLRGYKDCYSKIGSFDVNDRMIGLNSNGNIKVWLNENFAENHPPTEKPLLQTTSQKSSNFSYNLHSNKDQSEMVRNIVNVIEQKCQQGRYPPDFREKINKKASFIDAYNEIEQYCSHKQNFYVPDRIPLNSNVQLTKQSIQESHASNQLKFNPAESTHVVKQPITTVQSFYQPAPQYKAFEPNYNIPNINTYHYNEPPKTYQTPLISFKPQSPTYAPQYNYTGYQVNQVNSPIKFNFNGTPTIPTYNQYSVNNGVNSYQPSY